MKQLEGSEPIYVQLAVWLENEILAGRVKPEEKIYSQYRLSEIFGINPATALKGLNILVDKEIVYKKRGLGMFVSIDALKILQKEHKNEVITEQIRDLAAEAKLLEVSEEELIRMLKKEMRKTEASELEKSAPMNGQRPVQSQVQNKTKKGENHQ